MQERTVYASHADQVIAQGLRQMGTGITSTLTSEVQTAVPAGIVGLVIGTARYALNRGELIPNMVSGARDGGIFGAIVGWEFASQKYNAEAAGKGLSQAQWYDWLLANLLLVGLMVSNRNNLSKSRFIAETALVAQGINAITLAGARRTIGGLFSKVTGS